MQTNEAMGLAYQPPPFSPCSKCTNGYRVLLPSTYASPTCYPCHNRAHYFFMDNTSDHNNDTFGKPMLRPTMTQMFITKPSWLKGSSQKAIFKID